MQKQDCVQDAVNGRQVGAPLVSLPALPWTGARPRRQFASSLHSALQFEICSCGDEAGLPLGLVSAALNPHNSHPEFQTNFGRWLLLPPALVCSNS